MDQQLESSIFPEKHILYASFWQRLGAIFIDGLVLAIPNFLFRNMGSGGSLLVIIVQWLYFALQESGQAQATLGKRAMGLKVTDMSGNRITFGQATGRHFGKWISTLILFIGFLMVLWDEKRQALHDKMAGTLVIESK